VKAETAHNGPMGLFQHRPEEPTEWTGLPSEPWEPRSPNEELPPPVDDLGLFGAAGTTVSVPMELLEEDLEEDPEDDPEDTDRLGT